MVREERLEGVTHKRTQVLQLLVGYHNLGALNALRFLVVWLSPREPKKWYSRLGTSIQEFKHEEPKRREKTRDSPSFDPLAIAMAGIAGLETKHQTSKRGSIHILLDRQGLRKREKKNEITLFQPTRHGTNDSWMNEIRPHDPNPLVGHRDCATKSGQGYS